MCKQAFKQSVRPTANTMVTQVGLRVSAHSLNFWTYARTPVRFHMWGRACFYASDTSHIPIGGPSSPPHSKNIWTQCIRSPVKLSRLPGHMAVSFTRCVKDLARLSSEELMLLFDRSQRSDDDKNIVLPCWRNWWTHLESYTQKATSVQLKQRIFRRKTSPKRLWWKFVKNHPHMSKKWTKSMSGT